MWAEHVIDITGVHIPWTRVSMLLRDQFSLYDLCLSAVNLQRASKLSKRHAPECCFGGVNA